METGQWVKRKSYGGDIVFAIIAIQGRDAILEGIEFRLIADAPLDDLLTVEREQAEMRSYYFRKNNAMRWLEHYRDSLYATKFPQRIPKEQMDLYFEVPGRVLHLDGDANYLVKCLDVYQQIRVPVDGYHVDEKDMADALYQLLPQIRPDIVVITGHDSLLKSRRDQLYDLSSYKHSESFVRAVQVARAYDRNRDSLVIVAGACQSHFEALLQAGANFASSPGRIMIHALDPVQVASKIAYTPINGTIDMMETLKHTVSGLKGMGGVESRGTYRIGLPNVKAFMQAERGLENS